MPKSHTSSSIFNKCFSSTGSPHYNKLVLPDPVHSPKLTLLMQQQKPQPVLRGLFRKNRRPNSCPPADEQEETSSPAIQPAVVPRSQTQDFISKQADDAYDANRDQFLVDLNNRLLATIQESTANPAQKAKSASLNTKRSKFTKSPAMYNIIERAREAEETKISDLLNSNRIEEEAHENEGDGSSSTFTYDDDDDQDRDRNEMENLIGQEEKNSCSSCSSSVSSQSSLSLNTTPPSRLTINNEQSSGQESDEVCVSMSLMMMSQRFEQRLPPPPPPIPPRNELLFCDNDHAVSEIQHAQSLSESLNFIDEDASLILSNSSVASSSFELHKIEVRDERVEQPEVPATEMDTVNRAEILNKKPNILGQTLRYLNFFKRLRGLVTMKQSQSFDIERRCEAKLLTETKRECSMNDFVSAYRRPQTPSPARKFSTLPNDNEFIGNDRFQRTNEDTLSLYSIGFSCRERNRIGGVFEEDAPLAISENTTLTSYSYANLATTTTTVVTVTHTTWAVEC